MQLTIEVHLTSTELGGRTRPITAGYRSSWRNGDVVDGVEYSHDAPILVLEPATLEPGASGTAIVQPILADATGWLHLRAGDALTMVEGSREVGIGKVVEVDPASYDRHWSSNFGE